MSRPTIDLDALVAALTAYVPRVRGDAQLPTSRRGVAGEIGVPKSTLADYAGVADVGVLLDEIDEVARTRRETRAALAAAARGAKPARGAAHAGPDEGRADANRAPTDGGPVAGNGAGSAGLPPRTPYDEALTVAAYQEAAERAANAMRRFIGRHQQYRHVSDVPLVVRDLERTLREIRRALDDMLEVNETWLASDAGAAAPELGRADGAVLSLPLGEAPGGP